MFQKKWSVYKGIFLLWGNFPENVKIPLKITANTFKVTKNVTKPLKITKKIVFLREKK